MHTHVRRIGQYRRSKGCRSALAGFAATATRSSARAGADPAQRTSVDEFMRLGAVKQHPRRQHLRPGSATGTSAVFIM